MDQNQNNQKNSKNSRMFHLKQKEEKMYHSYRKQYGSPLWNFLEMPYLVSFISFPSYHRISSLAFICPIHVSRNCFAGFYLWMSLILVPGLIVISIPLIVMQRGAVCISAHY